MCQRSLQLTIDVIDTDVGIETIVVGLVLVLCHGSTYIHFLNILGERLQLEFLQDKATLFGSVGRVECLRRQPLIVIGHVRRLVVVGIVTDEIADRCRLAGSRAHEVVTVFACLAHLQAPQGVTIQGITTGTVLTVGTVGSGITQLRVVVVNRCTDAVHLLRHGGIPRSEPYIIARSVARPAHIFPTTAVDDRELIRVADECPVQTLHTNVPALACKILVSLWIIAGQCCLVLLSERGTVLVIIDVRLVIEEPVAVAHHDVKPLWLCVHVGELLLGREEMDVI